MPPSLPPTNLAPVQSPGISEVANYDKLFGGTGRSVLMLLGQNIAGLNTFGGSNGAVFFCRRASAPLYVMLKELVPMRDYIGYEFNYATLGTSFLSGMGRYQPMLKVRFDNAAWVYKDGSGNATTTIFPQTTANVGSLIINLASFSTAVTRLGVIVGFTGTSSGVVRCAITDNGTGLAVVPNLLPTATQLAAIGDIASSALVSNGGAIPDASYVFGTNVQDVSRLGANKMLMVPLANGIPPGSYTVTLTLTTVAGKGGGTVDRTYLAYLAYGTDTMALVDTGGSPSSIAELYRTDYIFPAVDASTNERSTLSARLSSSGSSRQLMGGGHGGEADTSAVWTVDGVATKLYATTTVSRARASNVATIVFAADTGARPGDVVTMTGLNAGASASYNAEGVTITGVSQTTVANDTITYANTGTNESTTADVNGLLFNHKVVFGDEIKLTQTGTLTHAVDGQLATVASTHTLNGAKLAVRSTITPGASLSCDTATYAALSSMYAGSRTTYGPTRRGDNRIRVIDTTTSGVLTAGNDSEVLSNRDYLGYITWDPTKGWASATVWKKPPINASLSLVQDRNPASSGVKKSYLRYSTTSPFTQLANQVIDGGYDRYDILRSPNYSHPLLVP